VLAEFDIKKKSAKGFKRRLKSLVKGRRYPNLDRTRGDGNASVLRKRGGRKRIVSIFLGQGSEKGKGLLSGEKAKGGKGSRRETLNRSYNTGKLNRPIIL